MENWLKIMGYSSTYGDNNEFLTQLKSASTADTKAVWKHIVTHVRPKMEVEMIKKQCLLHRLRTSTPQYFQIEDQLNNIKDFDSYVQKKKDQSNLKKLRHQVEEKKKVIAERLCKLELARNKKIQEEEILKEFIHKLNNLKMKKKNVERQIQKFESNTKLLQVLRTTPNKFVNYGPKISDEERKILINLAEMPVGSELVTLELKMDELLNCSKSLAPPSWDRTETLTDMEKLIQPLENILENRKAESIEIDKQVNEMKSNIIGKMGQEDINIDELRLLLDSFEGRMLKEALAIGEELAESKPPYELETLRHTIRRLNYQIDSKAKNLSQFLPIENEDYSNSDLMLNDSKTCNISLPSRPLIRNLINSVTKEIHAFLDLNLKQKPPDQFIDYTHPCISSYNQLHQLSNAMTTDCKLMALEEKIRNFNMPAIDVLSMNDGLTNKMNELLSNISEKIMHAKRETDELEDLYERVKAGLNFLRKDPLNEGLQGLQIEDRDISYWLHRFTIAEKAFKHEQWILNDILKNPL